MDNSTGVVKVVGMGLARLDEQADGNQNEFRTEMGRQALGTIDYMAPEQFQASAAADGRADIYSLGCTLFHLLTGRIPYPGNSEPGKALAHQRSPIPTLDAVRADVTPQMSAFCQRMMAKQPEDRPQFMEEVAANMAGF